MNPFLANVAASLGVPEATATAVVNIILHAGTFVTVLGILASVASAGSATLLTIGWETFKQTVKRLAKRGIKKAIAY
ncbi:MAG: uberolysin/carnocyclin family circular bacteriocin [Lactobacillales bacterium]|jgi:circularin A/uberolysin family circular bacteriocin|nr:uberolysin/carnocyclin family circular bacteriocin [Lactobacillales bacterium]